MTSVDKLTESDATDIWDAVVIGAGPAGAVVSWLLARDGVRTLLLEAKSFPRPKVCGGCLNDRAVSILQSVGLGEALERCNPAAIRRLQVHHAGRSVAFALPAGVSVSRERLDLSLVEAAQAAGVTFVPETRCRVAPQSTADYRDVRTTTSRGHEVLVRGRVVLACDGLGHPSLHGVPDVTAVVAPHSRIGLGAVVSDAAALESVPPETISMAVGAAGYVGLARAEDNQVTIAAAVDPTALSGGAPPSRVLHRVLQSAGVSADWLGSATVLRGTPPITQYAREVAAERLFLLGDSAGYVEPFTGEGMAAAIEAAVHVAEIAKQGVRNWTPGLAAQWQSLYERRIRSRQLACRSVAWLVRHPRLLRWSLASLALRPPVGAVLARWVGAAPRP